MKLIDSHCHLSYQYLESDIQSALDNHVVKMINISVDHDSIAQVVDISSKYDSVYGAVGIHPLYLSDLDEDLIRTSCLHKKIVAIGETGLDLFKAHNLIEQQQSLEQHIIIANEVQLPLILHTRNCDNEIKPFIKKAYSKNIKGVLHSFTGTLELAKYAMDHGFYISFSGIVTFKNAQSVHDLAQYIPLNSILIETDSPYLSPDRGKRNSPANVKIIADKLSEIKNESIHNIANITYNNTLNLFSKLRC